jgi:Flp pilus assembly protein TadD
VRLATGSTPAAEEGRRRSRVRSVAVLILVAVAALGAHWPALDNGYTYDDAVIAAPRYQDGRVNPLIHELASPLEYWRRHYWHGSEPRGSLYRPLTVYSYALVHHAGSTERQDAATRQHAVNLLLHALAAVLAAALLAGLNAPPWAVLGGGLAFALHSVHSEAVASISGRAELLAFVFGAAGALLLGTRRRGAAAGLALFAACCSKENGLGWLAIAPLYAGLRGRLPPPATLAMSVALPALAYLVPRQLVLGALPGPEQVSFFVNPLRDAGALERMPTATFLLGLAAFKLCWPFHPVSDYGAHVLPRIDGLLDPRFAGTAALLLAFLAAGVIAWRRRAALPVLGVASFFVFTLPTANLLFPVGVLFAERTMYAPSLAASALLAAGLTAAARRRSLLLASWLALAVWLAAAATVDLQRCRAWHSDEVLFTTDVARAPNSVALHLQAGIVKGRNGDYAGQVRHFERALEIEPRNARGWSLLALVHSNHGRWEQAAACIERGMEHLAIDFDKERPQLLFARGLMHMHTGRPSAAVADFEAALAVEPRYLAARVELLAVLRREGRLEDLHRALADAEALFPGDANLVLNRGLLAWRDAGYREAASLLQAAVPLLPWNPHRVEGTLALADCLARLGQRDAAARLLLPLDHAKNLDQGSRRWLERLRADHGLR